MPGRKIEFNFKKLISIKDDESNCSQCYFFNHDCEKVICDGVIFIEDESENPKFKRIYKKDEHGYIEVEFNINQVKYLEKRFGKIFGDFIVE